MTVGEWFECDVVFNYLKARPSFYKYICCTLSGNLRFLQIALSPDMFALSTDMLCSNYGAGLPC